MIALKAALLALALQAVPAPVPPQQQPSKATVSGVVVNGNGEPVPNIRVTMGKLGVNLGPLTQFMVGDRPTRETTITSEAFAFMAGDLEAEIAGGAIPPEELRAAQAFKSVPLDDIQEITVTPQMSMSVVYKSAPPVQTDANGRFTFNVDSGTYRLSFSGTGFAKVDYGQRTAAGQGVPLTLTPGETKTDIVMRMLPVGAVTGQIRDNTGQPVAAVPVQIFRFVYDANGKRTTQNVASTRTNDRGEYRMYYLTPGRYYMSAGSPPSANGSFNEGFYLGGTNFATQNRVSQIYAQSYYPGSLRESDATPFEVPPGSEVRGIDVFVAPQQTYKIRGRVVDSRTGQPPPQVGISIGAQTNDISGFINSGGSRTTTYRNADGSFELPNVAAGDYLLSASIPRANNNQIINFDNMSPAEQQEYFRAQQAEDLTRPKASIPLTVNSDLDGVVLSMALNGTISGRIRGEGASMPNLDFVRVQFRNNVPTNVMEGGQNSRAVMDGAFKVENVRPGEYRIAVAGMPEGFYLKEARAGQTDILNAPLRYGGGEASGLELVLSPNVGTLDGSTEPGAQVVLIPARDRERTDLFRPVTADTAGHFAIPNITPGDYILAAWESLEPFSFFDPNLIRQAEMSGKALRIEESAKQTLSVTAIK